MQDHLVSASPVATKYTSLATMSLVPHLCISLIKKKLKKNWNRSFFDPNLEFRRGVLDPPRGVSIHGGCLLPALSIGARTRLLVVWPIPSTAS